MPNLMAGLNIAILGCAQYKFTYQSEGRFVGYRPGVEIY